MTRFVDKARAWDAVIAARRDERAKLSSIAEQLHAKGLPPFADEAPNDPPSTPKAKIAALCLLIGIGIAGVGIATMFK